MKKSLLLLAAGLLAATGSYAQFTTVGPATFNTTSGVIDLVPGTCTGAHVNGAAWDNNTTIDFTRSFTIDYEASFTTYGNSGADGHVVVFGENINTAAGSTSVGGTAGGHMGYYFNNAGGDFNNSIGIEFDIFDNGAGLSDIANNHVMIAANANPASVIAGPVNIVPGGGSVEDGKYYAYRIEWICEDQVLNVYWNDMRTPRISTVFNPASVFSNPAVVNWGFTAARQVSCSHHLIRRVVVQQNEGCGGCMDAELSIGMLGCADAGYDVGFGAWWNNAGMVATVIKLDFGDGSSITMHPPFFSPLHTYTSWGTHIITYTIVGYDPETGECCSERITAEIYIPDCDEGGEGDDGVVELHKPGATGLNDQMRNQNLAIYPNPTSGTIDVSMKGNNFNNVTVTDIAGKVIHNQVYDAVANAKIQLEGVANGTYIVQVKDINGTLTTQKIVVNRSR